ncbi:hypothetical protein [Aliikangiella sp. IMCC44359]|uniref:hypothetical protein n=1 Tax=Aliikangiella sp. IMCC44359 TaxID=3459125 RepID=UPI00403AFE26
MKSLIIACSIQTFIILLFVIKFFYFNTVKPTGNNQYTNQPLLLSVQNFNKQNVIIESSVEEHQLALITNRKLLSQFRTTALAWQPNLEFQHLSPSPQKHQKKPKYFKVNKLNAIND